MLSNRTDGTVDSMHDETQNKHDEEQLYKAVLDAKAASSARSAFLATLNHEIRTAMNSIMGFTELALGEEISPNARAYLGNVLESSIRLLQCIDDSLGFSKNTSGNMEPARIPCTMPDRKTAVGHMAQPVFEGEVLLCEDNKMNQLVLCEHLARVGLKTRVAENGREGVEMVQRRIHHGDAPFNLIFMDIHMPVMDGLEAAAKIMEFGTGPPIIAMTANVMEHDRELYRQRGMQGYLAKPFTAQELWDCLLKYVSPVHWKEVNGTQHARADETLQYQLMRRFVRANPSKCREIARAIEVNDRKLAHRLAHTLKGNAALLGATRLEKAAGDVERQLAEENISVTPKLMRVLDAELAAVLKEFAILLEANAPTQITVRPVAFNAERAQALLATLKPMFDSGNPECLQYIDELRAMSGSATLIQQMEDFDFEPAIATLAALQKEWV